MQRPSLTTLLFWLGLAVLVQCQTYDKGAFAVRLPEESFRYRILTSMPRLKILTSLSIKFSVKSGGHTPFPGGSNIQGGVTISLAALNDVTVSANRKTVSIGPGNRWIDVTKKLDPLGLAVVGGRVAEVGVSGLLLGGGISFLSEQHGWACDNVQNYEVVLATGEIVNATPTQNEDLFWALRGGGGSSFGIVTRDAHVLSCWPTAPQFGGNIVLTSLYHLTHAATQAAADGAVPDIFEGFVRLPRQISNTTTIAPVSTHLEAISDRYGFRKTWWDTTVSIGDAGDYLLLLETLPKWDAHVETLLAAAEEAGDTIIPQIAFQPISTNVLKEMQKNGGNALGLDVGDGPLVLIHIMATWSNEKLDCLIEKRSKEFIEDIEARAEARGQSNGYKYINYAGRTQDVFGSYGEENHKRLREVSQKYDPEDLLQNLWRGYFKVR
ncbi:FAD binding domain-containing protein [Verticillium alfalfae VaMs.102]|uniref:FAD binding domain-containing protein n=1 Tax=Verticillium alfalfae (strain VaMs.102 / ATCC MYA-4576 / FGSC 10136) TaxID=526221 RepID=C9SNS9_VERA1|nr:FAD binding domain-containing protein [Verticillium alfalfae VaMs.102]EEY20444.1 FAD binding domain-containing protein [Verticillium alfalfae VaMs.102]